MQMLQGVAISLVVLCLTVVIGLSVAQNGLDMIGFEGSDEFCATKDSMVTMTEDAFSWYPMLILAAIGGIAIAYVARYMGWLTF